MLDAHHISFLSKKLSPRLLRTLLESHPMCGADIALLQQVIETPFMAPYQNDIISFLRSTSADPFWKHINQGIANDSEYNHVDRFIRREQRKEMRAFLLLQADPQAMAMFDSLPPDASVSIRCFCAKFSTSDDINSLYPEFQAIMHTMAQIRSSQSPGYTPLMFMAMRGKSILTQALLDAGAHISINDKGMRYSEPEVSLAFENISACESYTALELAIKYQRNAIQPILLDYGADIRQGSSVLTALHLAYQQEDPVAIQLLESRDTNKPLLFSATSTQPKPRSSLVLPAVAGLALAISIGVTINLDVRQWAILIMACLPVVAGIYYTCSHASQCRIS